MGGMGRKQTVGYLESDDFQEWGNGRPDGGEWSFLEMGFWKVSALHKT